MIGSSNVAIGRLAGRNISASNTIAIGTNARATATQAVAIGYKSLANVANTVSVGSASKRRRIMNVAPGKRPTDAVNLAQLQAATAAASPASTGDVDSMRRLIGDMRRELQGLHALVQRQQVEIARIKAAQEARRSASN